MATQFRIMQRQAGTMVPVQIGTVNAGSADAALKKWLKDQPDETDHDGHPLRVHKPEAGYVEWAGSTVTAVP